jgi:sulfur-carrier protein adenylyltransferase/sulfurtransferase
MPADKIIEIDAEALHKYMATHQESDYLIIDVRQPEEYADGHIPGARHLPIMELVPRLFELPGDRDLLFYCSSGGRSAAAAVLAFEEEIGTGKIYNLRGGMLAWDGHRIEGAPRWHLFDTVETTAKRLYLAMDLERGAERFYQYVAKQYKEAPFSATYARLAKAEVAHARAIYQFWQAETDAKTDFETIYTSLKGEVLEGGEALESVLDKVRRMADSACLPLVELALGIEYAAYDLYRTLADNGQDPGVVEAFMRLAPAEKAHMEALIKTVALCGRS